MKNLLIFILISSLHFVSIGQCKKEIYDQRLEENMFFICSPIEKATKTYVAEVTAVSGDNFSCRFLHSNSIYEFIDLNVSSTASTSLMNATVKSNIGGIYATGTIFTGNIYMADPEDCNLSETDKGNPYFIIATFQDEKSYLGMVVKVDNGYSFRFAHTNSVYNTDENFKVLSTQGGGYAIGSQMKVVHARRLNFGIKTDTIRRN